MEDKRNVDVVQEAYKCFGEGNLPGLLDLFSEDIEWVLPPMTNVPIAGTRRGKEQTMGFFTTLAEMQETESFQPREFIASNGTVVAMGEYRFRVKETGKAFDCRFAHRFSIANGKISGFEEFTDTASIVEAYGS